MVQYLSVTFRSIGWRLGLQALTGVITTLFVLGTFYRSASLYHPQRRAILHLKSQKRKIKSKDKEKNKSTVNEDTTPPFFDFTTLKSRTVQILLVSTMVAGLGLYAPLLYMVSLYGLVILYSYISKPKSMSCSQFKIFFSIQKVYCYEFIKLLFVIFLVNRNYSQILQRICSNFLLMIAASSSMPYND